MRWDEDEDRPPDTEQVIEEFLGENPRARELRLLRAALEQRHQVFVKERAQAHDAREKQNLQGRIAELEKQIEALRQEEAITQFVEDSVRVTVQKPSLSELEAD
jgi:ABC-type phosphate transport system auxiliary subunit